MSRPDPAAIFAALGDPTRLMLLDRLGGGEQPLAALVYGMDISRQGIAKHLAVLEAAGLVVSHTSGRERRFRLRDGGITSAQDHLARIARGWEDTLARLKAHVER